VWVSTASLHVPSVVHHAASYIWQMQTTTHNCIIRSFQRNSQSTPYSHFARIPLLSIWTASTTNWSYSFFCVTLFMLWVDDFVLCSACSFVGLVPEPEIIDDEPKALKELYHTGYKWRKHNIFYDEWMTYFCDSGHDCLLFVLCSEMIQKVTMPVNTLPTLLL